MQYSCNICNYNTSDRGNFFRHNHSKKHILKNNQNNEIYKIVKESREDSEELICENCNKVFVHKNSYYRHIRHFCKIVEKINNLENKIEVLKKEKEIEVLKSKLEMKDQLIELKSTENEFHKKLTIGAGQTVNKSLSAIAFLMQNYQKATPLKQIPHEEFKRLVYEENYGKKIHKNRKITDFETAEIITSFFKQKKLSGLLGNVIVSFYRVQKEYQSLWVSDISRKSYVINEKTYNGTNQWATDRNGVKVSKIIIEPILLYIDRILVTYMCDIHKILKETNYSDINFIEKLKYSTDLRSNLCTKKLANELLKSLAPNFYLEKLK
jgi:hypothetical protein